MKDTNTATGTKQKQRHGEKYDKRSKLKSNKVLWQKKREPQIPGTSGTRKARVCLSPTDSTSTQDSEK